MAVLVDELKCGVTKEFKIDDVHAKSYLPKDKKWKLVFSDEFDGDSLDESKWNYRLNYWGARSPAFTTEGVEVSNGTLKINLVRKGDDFSSAHLQTGGLTFDNPKEDKTKFWPFGKKDEFKFMHRYGYYEIRCKQPKNPDWHSAFWLQSPSIGAHPDPSVAGVECDIMENYRQYTTGRILCGCGWGGYGAEGKWAGHFEFPYKETEDGWHYYGVDWSPNGYIFYANGEEVGRQLAPECAVSNVEQFILVSTECHGYNRVFGKKGEAGESINCGSPVKELFDAVLPDVFEVDFVRVYDEVK